MAIDFDGATDRVDYANQVDLSTLSGMTISCFINRDVASAVSEYLVNFESGGTVKTITWISNNELLGCSIGRATANQFRHANGPVVTDGQYDSVIVTWAGGTPATDIKIYVNNVEVTYQGGGDEQNGVGAVAATDAIALGGRNSSDTRNFDGKEAEVAIWDRVISAGERAGLAAALSPAFYPNGLRFHSEMIRLQRDRITGVVGVLDGTSVVAHPRMIYPAPTRIIHVPAAAVTTSPWYAYANQ